MTTTLNADTRQQLMERTEQLTPHMQAQWGKMTAYQMTAHCTIWNRWVLGVDNPIPCKRDPIGKIFGHGAFRKLTREQIGIFALKHMDHHLRQVGM
ncbi:MAG: hypothetical protein WA952_17870 [Lewinella sp.]